MRRRENNCEDFVLPKRRENNCEYFLEGGEQIRNNC
jgi:hypothetical protein